uniref:Serine aminopeptidase S33 domain-containing protein n=1 Tax=Aegilops tauschii subsp. strangulata TaxID=200361 RepID=A0A453KFP6_AEGTS
MFAFINLDQFKVRKTKAGVFQIADEMRPHPVVVSVLKLMTNIIPTWKIVPTTDVIDAAYRMQEKRDEIRNNPHCYQGKPRLKTAYELLKVSLNLENNVLSKVSLPFLIVHGGDDKVTDPSVSDLLYRSAVSQDKKLNLYPGMWHALTSGESPENIHTVFQDIIAWLDQRSSPKSSSSAAALDLSSEMEQKAKHDEQNIDKQ